jgi:prepilin-type N-terminal cleavage/methylation domain-containing protein
MQAACCGVIVAAHGRVRPPSRHSARGFSLVETLVATAILTTALAGLAHLLVAATRANQVARADTMATLLAMQRLEELLARPWSATAQDEGQELLDAAGRHIGGEGAPARPPAYVRQWSARPTPVGTELLALTVMVTRRHDSVGQADAGRRDGAVMLFTLQRRGAP